DTVAGGAGGGHGKTYQLPVGEGILLGLAADGIAPVHPCSDVLGEYRRAVVVVACIKGVDARIGLQRQRAIYVRERIRRQPGCSVVVRLARVHSVARGAWTGRLAT